MCRIMLDSLWQLDQPFCIYRNDLYNELMIRYFEG